MWQRSSSSSTARLIAASTMWLAGDERLGAFVDRRAAELSRLLLARPSLASRALRLLCAEPLRFSVRSLERLCLPGIQLHYALRKRFIEDCALAALRDGVRQVVVIGAGFDTLAVRLAAEHPRSLFFEIDREATQRRKVALLPRACGLPNLRFASHDLTRGDLRHALPACDGYDAAARTFFVAEGVLMYLAPPEVDAVFEFARAHSAAGSLVAWTFMEPLAGGRIAFRGSSRLVDLWLRLRGEVFRSALDAARLPAFLARRGFALERFANAETLRSRYLASPSLAGCALAAGENICLARSLPPHEVDL